MGKGFISPISTTDGNHFQVKGQAMSRFTPTSSNDLLSFSNGNIQSHFNPQRQESQADGATHHETKPIDTTPLPNGFSPNGASHASSQNGTAASQNGYAVPKQVESQTLRPVWDRDRRELRFGDTVVKRFKWPAGNQESVLNAFEDQGWPTNISDPLDVDPKICPKRRLHDTLKCLNRKQLCGTIKFRGDGTGKGVRLEINLDDGTQIK